MGLLTSISLFTGAGGLDQASESIGIRTVCRVEWDDYAQAVLMSRIHGGQLHDAPLWDDVSTFDGKPWAGLVDVVFGGFPCQDVSFAGKRASGERLVEGTRSGLWREFARIIREVGPRFVLVENVPGLLTGGLGDVLGDLAEMGFAAEWEVLSAAAVGAPHLRERVFVVAYPHQLAGKKRGDDFADARQSRRGGNISGGGGADDCREPYPPPNEKLADADGDGRTKEYPTPSRLHALRDAGAGGADVADATHKRDVRWDRELPADEELGKVRDDNGTGAKTNDGRQWWETEPPVGRVVDGLAYRVDRLRCTGNGVVKSQAVPFFQKIKDFAEG